MTDEDWATLLDRLEADADRILAAPAGAVEVHDIIPWAVRRVPAPRPPDAPAYLDVDG